MSSKYSQPMPSYNPDYSDNFREQPDYTQNNRVKPSNYGQNTTQSYVSNNNPTYQPLEQQPTHQQQHQPQQQQYPRPTSNQYVNRQPVYNNNYDLYSHQLKEDNPDKFNWIKFGKSIVIYTILFLIMSHLKMNDFLCSFIPPLTNNEILCMTIKGIVMSLIIIVIQKILN